MRRLSPLVALALAVGVVIGLSVVAGADPYVALGNTDPGAAVRVGTPLLRLASELTGMLCVGSLLYAVGFTRPEPDGTLSAQGYAARRAAARWAAGWLAATLVLVPFDAADVAGLPLSSALPPRHLGVLIDAQESSKAWLVTAAGALAVAVGARAALIRWQSTLGLLLVALLGLLPPVAVGHSSSDAGHDVATGALVVHVLAVSVWVGLLVALLRPFVRRAPRQPQLLRRYGRLAGACWLLLAASGALDALVLVPPSRLLDTGYGGTLLAKVILVAALGVTGAVLRRRALAAQAFWRLAAVELVVLAATVGLSVALSHLAPPAFVGRRETGEETLIGYDLHGAPTPWRLLTDWRVDVVFGPLAVLLAVTYLAGVRRLRRRADPWPAARTSAFVGGCVVLLLATCSGIGRYAPGMFSLHITSHMLLAMAAPLLLALGGPLTLLRAAVPPAADDALPGPREWLALLGRSPAVRALTHPLVALGLFAASPFLLYLTGLFDAAVRFHWADLAIDAWFLAVGYVFAWLVVGVDPGPRRLPAVARLGLLVAAMPFDTVFAAVLLSTHRVIGNGAAGANMYAALDLPWVHGLLSDQHTAGAVALGIGEAVLFAAIAVLLAQWTRLEDTAAEEAALLAGVGARRTILSDASRRP